MTPLGMTSKMTFSGHLPEDPVPEGIKSLILGSTAQVLKSVFAALSAMENSEAEQKKKVWKAFC